MTEKTLAKVVDYSLERIKELEEVTYDLHRSITSCRKQSEQYREAIEKTIEHLEKNRLADALIELGQALGELE